MFDVRIDGWLHFLSWIQDNPRGASMPNRSTARGGGNGLLAEQESPFGGKVLYGDPTG
jgi:hypothetical protein